MESRGRKGEMVSWKLRETRVRGVRKGVASGDGKGGNMAENVREPTSYTHTIPRLGVAN